MNVSRYLERIRYDRSLVPNAATLAALHHAHLLAVPFENLDIHLRRPIVLQPELLFDKIVNRGRGGFCYELNGLFAELLRALGFRVTLLSARVFNAAGELGEEFDHLALRVDLDEPWLADVGFGDSFRLPLRLEWPEPQSDGFDDYRVAERHGYHFVERRDADGWRSEYRFTLMPRRFEEFVPMCDFHQTSPESPFTRKRVCTIATPEGRLTLAEGKLIRSRGAERIEEEVAEEARGEQLGRLFGIQ